MQQKKSLVRKVIFSHSIMRKISSPNSETHFPFFHHNLVADHETETSSIFTMSASLKPPRSGA